MEFSYSGAMGPNRWGSINPKFLECARGKWQSPVNIVKKEVLVNKNLKPLLRDYHPATATLVNNGFNVGVRTSLSLSLFFTLLYSSLKSFILRDFNFTTIFCVTNITR